MIDLRALRDDFEAVAAALTRRGVDRAELERLAEQDARRRALIVEGDQLRSQRKQAGKAIGQASSPEERERLIAQTKEASTRLSEVEAEQAQIEADLDAALAHLPNLPHPDAPDGHDEDDAVPVRWFGTAPQHTAPARDHVELGEALGILDLQRAAKIAGTRNALLRGPAVWLELGLVRYALDYLDARGHTPVIPPVLVREHALYGTGFLPGSAEEIYHVPADDKYLVGTSEVPLAAMHDDEILDSADLPLRYAGFSTNFRREAGAHGRDTRGLMRVHQFDKVEMFSFTTAEQSDDEHERLTTMQVELLEGLGLHGRVVDIAVGDLGASAQRKYDCEVWLPGQERYRELTSCSNCTDYQARRLRCRHRAHPEEDTALVHTLNGTACAVGRTIAALLETHQRADGTVAVPETLVPYVGLDVLTPPA